MSCDPATGISFRNDLQYTEQLNPYTYRNFYNGGGVGLGDFDGDGQLDVFFTGNLVSNKLYLNRGNWRFEDITEKAGVACPDTWSTGVAVVDIDADGDQDLYVCKAGPPAGERIEGMTGVRHNELFLNNGDATFTEASAAYGLDIVGLSIHAAFFDYDGDGDLDAYLLNNSTRSTTGYDLKEGLREIPDPEGGNKLLKNLSVERSRGEVAASGPLFTEVTQEAGIYASAIGFGLGVTVGDVNDDHLPDLFVSNDFFERDYLYFNQGDGTFREALTEFLPEISQGSMGADLADLNNDGLPELFVTEMLPHSEFRRKTTAAFNGWNKYQLYRDKGYHQQFSRNVLQLNQGQGRFSEVSRMAGVAATDWSWGALLFDMNNDGLRDIFVANGNGKDLLDQDYLNFEGNQAGIRKALKEGKTITDIIDKIPSQALLNGVFRAEANLDFTDVATQWGLDQETFSNGSAYGDLDNDGDLDLVVNNIDGIAGVYRNNTTAAGLTLHLRPRPENHPDAIGAKLYAFSSGQLSYAELQPMRGFQSTVDKRLHVGTSPDSLLLRWPDGSWESFTPQPRGLQVLEQGQGRARTQDAVRGWRSKPAAPVTLRRQRSLDYHVHTEDAATEFDRDPLLLLGLNNEGPAFTIGRPTKDNTRHGFLGGSAGQPGKLFLVPGKYVPRPIIDLSATVPGENVDAVFFDANGDGADDLYVVNGSHQFNRASTALVDLLYLSVPGGRHQLSGQPLPSATQFSAGSCARPYDVDGDGDQDLFIGGRFRAGTYGLPADSYLLLNDGKGNFSNAKLPALSRLGLVTDARWGQLDEDPDPELVVAREWGSLLVLHFANGSIVDTEEIPNSAGLWHRLKLADLNGDKRLDIVAGNHGLNSQLRATTNEPLELHINDFDGNGKAEQITVGYDLLGNQYPLVLRDDLVKQMPGLRKTVPGYADYAQLSFSDLFPQQLREKSIVGEVQVLASAVILNGTEGFEIQALPQAAQLAPTYAIAVADLDADGDQDLILGGNQTVAKPELGINAASFGNILLNDGTASFTAYGPAETGMVLSGDVRRIITIHNRLFAVARSNGSLLELQID